MSSSLSTIPGKSLTASSRAEIVAGLKALLADTYSLYLKTHGYHWNVRGPNFASLHVLFSDQYNEMWLAIDTLAERIRALGDIAPQGYGAFGNLTAIRDGDGEKDWEAMVTELRADQDILIATARAAFPAAEAANDQATMDLITQRLDAHEKHAWMLRATLGER